MSADRIGVAFIGCGNVAELYAKDLPNHPAIEFLGAADMDPARAEALTAKYGGTAYPSPEALLQDSRVQIVVNLTTFQAHYSVISQALQAGKHVYSEKPLSMTYAESKQLVALAAEKKLRLACSPFTLMGEAQQTAWKMLRQEALGSVRVVYAEANQGRIEVWHPSPAAFYQVGVVYDVGVYPITLLATMLGPVRRVSAFARVVKADRVTKDGVPYHVETPDWVNALLELENGAVARLTMTFYVTHQSKQSGMEFHGDTGSLYLTNSYSFDAPVEYAAYGEPYQPVPLVRPGFPGIPWAAGVAELVTAIQEGRPHRFNGDLAAHVSETMDAIHTAYRTQQTVAVESTFTPVKPMAWAE